MSKLHKEVAAYCTKNPEAGREEIARVCLCSVRLVSSVRGEMVKRGEIGAIPKGPSAEKRRRAARKAMTSSQRSEACAELLAIAAQELLDALWPLALMPQYAVLKDETVIVETGGATITVGHVRDARVAIASFATAKAKAGAL